MLLLWFAALNDITLTTTAEQHVSLTEKSESKFGLSFKPLAVSAISGRVDADSVSAQSTADLAVGTLISGNAVAMQSGNDINIHGSQVVADSDIALNAARDINITAAINTYTDDTSHTHTQTGVLSGNNFLGATWGVGKLTQNQNVVSTEAAGSLVGSIDGRVDITAGRDANIVGSELFSQNGMSIDAQNINIAAAENTTTVHYDQTYKQVGVTVALQSPAASAAMGAYTAAQGAARNTGTGSDARLAGLYTAQLGQDGLRNRQGNRTPCDNRPVESRAPRT